jgi:hypothetical protein
MHLFLLLHAALVLDTFAAAAAAAAAVPVC